LMPSAEVAKSIKTWWCGKVCISYIIQWVCTVPFGVHRYLKSKPGVCVHAQWRDGLLAKRDKGCFERGATNMCHLHTGIPPVGAQVCCRITVRANKIRGTCKQHSSTQILQKAFVMSGPEAPQFCPRVDDGHAEKRRYFGTCDAYRCVAQHSGEGSGCDRQRTST
jgi:hypothetical protein